MTIYGANPDMLDALGKTLTNQIEAVTTLESAVTGALTNSTWTGPARDKFEADWNGTFKSALGSLKTAFEASGGDCNRRANDLRTVMGGVG